MDVPAGSGSELWGRIIQFRGSTRARKARRFSSHAVQRYLLAGTLVFSDAVMVSLALILAWYLRIESGILVYSSGGRFDDYLRMVAVAVLCCRLCSGSMASITILAPGRDEGIRDNCQVMYVGVVLLHLCLHVARFPASRGWR